MRAWPLLLLLVVPSPVLAQERLPFGLDVLHWRIGKADAIAAFSPLQTPGRATPNDPMTNQESLVVSSYDWHGCNFRLVFYFAKDGLSVLTLDAKFGQPGCSDAALAELSAKYGEGTGDASGSDPEHRAFKTSETRAAYNGLYGGKMFSVTLMQNGGEPLLIAD